MPRNLRDDSVSPVSFPVNVARLPQKGMPVRIDADATQREALAKTHGLEAVASFVANLLVISWKRNGVRVSGTVKAEITQTCVVTLEPLEATIDEEVEGLFLPEDSKLGRQGFESGGEIVLDVEGDDAPETFSGDYIDVGALSEEYFGLAIDPYPRKQGVQLGVGDADVEAEKDAAPDDWKAKLSGLASRK